MPDQEIMKQGNLTVTRRGQHLILDIDTAGETQDSKSQKSDTVATTGGNVLIPGFGGLKVGLNAYRPK